jgi:hypothetical protein
VLSPLRGARGSDREIAQFARWRRLRAQAFRDRGAVFRGQQGGIELAVLDGEEDQMLSRSIAIVIGTWLPMLAVTLPIGPTHAANAIVFGIIGTLLSLAALADNRARVATAVVGAWVALSPFIFDSTLIEKVLTVSWGMTMFACMIGPFSESPRVEVVRAPATRVPPVEDEHALPRAA